MVAGRDGGYAGCDMMMLKYLVMLVAFGLFGSATALVGYDIFLSAQLRRLLRRTEHVERMG